ncbi:autotransporter domain-containing protein, partial [Phaeobacter sp. PT47_59]|uniref:DUF7933 domain-containing protein n=1 Tax=Phaeobacter sp. PT47_59 TaxID=3029979 RepID=UPI00238008CB
NVTLTGTINAEAEIENLTSSTTNTVPDGGTDDQGNKLAGVMETLTYTVTNSGAAALTLETATASNLVNVTVDAISAPGDSSVAANGGTTVFEVQYTPTGAGAFSFDVSFVNGDSDESPFSFTIGGSAAAAPTFNQSFAPDTIRADGTATVTFTIDNTANGQAATGLAFSNGLPTGLTVATPANADTSCTGGTLTAASETGTISYSAGAVDAGASCTVSVDVSAADDGTYSNTTGDLSSDLGNSGSSAATLTVASPEIDLQRPASTSIANGGNDDQGSLNAGEQQSLTYTIANQGNATLTISGTPSSSALNNVSVDAISAPDAAAIAANGTTTFTVLYTPTLDGAFSFDLTVASDDADEGSYTITVSGTALGTAEFSFGSSENGPLEDGGTDRISGIAVAGDDYVITYIISNPGTGELTINTPTISQNISNQINVVINSITLSSNTVASAGGTSTLEISYSAPQSGRFSFDLMISYAQPGSRATSKRQNGNAEASTEEEFSITIAGRASGTPEIDISSSESGPLEDGDTDTVSSSITSGTEATITYTITNSGTDTLKIKGARLRRAISGAENVTVNRMTLDTKSVAALGGTATLTLSYTATAGGAFGFDLSLGNTDADENPFDVNVRGAAQGVASSLQLISGSDQSAEINQPFGEPLVVTATEANGAGVAGVAVTFTAPASGASLIFAATGTNTETVITGADGTATSSDLTANGIASTYQGTPTLAPYPVTASARRLRSVSFTMTNARNDTADIRRTQEVIAAFVTNRANTIVSNQPDLLSRLAGGAQSRQRAGNGLSFSATPNGHSGSFSFSYRAFAEQTAQRNDGTKWRSSLSSAADQSAVGNTEGDTAAEDGGVRRMAFLPRQGRGVQEVGNAQVDRAATEDSRAALAVGQAAQTGWDFWAQGTYAVNDNLNAQSKSGLFFAGVDYRGSDRAVFGIMGQLDITDEENRTANTSAKGVGWMVGPYAVIRLDRNLYLDASATYGRSKNKVNALGLFEDDFDTRRYLVQAGLTGDFKVNATLTVSPFARFTYFNEKQKSYTDSLGRRIPAQEFDLGRLEFGPKLSWEINRGTHMQFSPYVSFSGIYDFNKLLDSTPTDATLASAESDFRGRLEAGATWFLPNRGVKVAIDGFYDGIGATGFDSYGASVNIQIPF